MTNDGMMFTSSGSRPLFGTDMFSGILATVCDIALVVEPSGIIRNALSGQESRLFSEAANWPGRNIVDLIDDESARKFKRVQEKLSELDDEDGRYRWAELIHHAERGDPYPIRYSVHCLANDDAVLMLGRDQRPVIEMQQQLLNAQIALERDFEAQREADARYRLLMEFTSDAIVLVSMTSGRIVDLNMLAAIVLGSGRAELIGASFAEQFSLAKGIDLLGSLALDTSGQGGTSVEFPTLRGGNRVEIRSRQFRAAGERLAFCKLSGPGEETKGLGSLASDLFQLFQLGTDAIVFTNKDGVIEAASDAFLNITDSPSPSAVVGRSIGEFLGRGAVDLKVLLENARRAGHLRSYSTKLTTDFDAHISVELSATWLGDRSDPKLALVIRDATSATALRTDFALGQGDMRGVMELVGSSNLKDIVAETTNVVEKICIETAIELTRNNRVAAAEMLGLSRQSLYVKLRKYGLLSREEE